MRSSGHYSDRHSCACVGRVNVDPAWCLLSTLSGKRLILCSYIVTYKAAVEMLESSQDSLGTVVLHCSRWLWHFQNRNSQTHTHATQQCVKYTFTQYLRVTIKRLLCNLQTTDFFLSGWTDKQICSYTAEEFIGHSLNSHQTHYWSWLVCLFAILWFLTNDIYSSLVTVYHSMVKKKLWQSRCKHLLNVVIADA